MTPKGTSHTGLMRTTVLEASLIFTACAPLPFSMMATPPADTRGNRVGLFLTVT